MKDQYEDIACHICGNDELSKIKTAIQFNSKFYVSACPNDGLVFLSPRWKQGKYKSFYSKEYDNHYRHNELVGKQAKISKYNRSKEIFMRLKDFDMLEGRNKVLEVGSGMGWFLEYLNNNDSDRWDLSAIESSRFCLDNLKNVIKAKVISNDVDSNWHIDHENEFDLVVMRHVLEHFLFPIDALKKIRTSLSDKGILYIAVPDMMNPRGSLENYWFRIAHTFYFSKPTLLKIADLAGFKALTVKSFNHELWAVFKVKDCNSQNINNVNTYSEQMSVLNSYRA